jgi:nucleoid-associated protein YgaU
MTRENKLGLLVGLAFIIVVGILISDHLSSTNEPVAAALNGTGDTLRSGLGEPGNDDVAPVLRAPSAVAPSQPLVINAELNHRNANPPVRFVQQGNTAGGNAITPSDPKNTGGQRLTIAERLRQAAQQQGEQLVPVNGVSGSNNGTAPVPPPVNVPQPDQSAAPRSYNAQPGDSLASIAKKMYGSASKANRQAIINANADLLDDPDLIVAGQTYMIPPLHTAAAVHPAAPATPASTQEPKPANAQTIVYVVQPHDTLWSIAVNEVGSSAAVAAIRELNQSVLNGSDRVRPNMKLKLPNKS